MTRIRDDEAVAVRHRKARIHRRCTPAQARWARALVRSAGDPLCSYS
ncbi:MAG: hypothetical protein WBG41_18690 [Acidimicrobiales bacterium]